MRRLSVDELQSLCNTNPLIAVDRALLALSGCREGEVGELMGMMTQAIAEYLEKPIGNEPLNLFNQSLSRHSRRFVGISLVRLLALNDYYFEHDHRFRVKAFALFDDVLSYDLYKKLDIASSEQTYRKSMNLKDAAPEAETKMREALDSLRSLDHLGEFQERFMRAINHDLVKAIIWPFASRSLVHKSRLDDIFGAIRRYRQASRTNVVDAYERARAVVGGYSEESRACGTLYCKQYLIELADGLNRLLEKDFYNSDFGQPAELAVRPLGKKYPFHQKGHRLNLGFVAENHGPGYAFGVELTTSSIVDNVVVKRPTLQLGRLQPGSVSADFPAEVVIPEEIAFIEVEVKWENADRSIVRHCYQFELEGQRTDIDWDQLAMQDPYSLEPVDRYEQLVGREETMSQLLRQSRAERVGSSYMYGQKRVGKTSIAKALMSRLSKYTDLMVIYLEGGEYIGGGPEGTLNRLGEKICRRLKKSDRRLAKLAIPEFQGALYPLSDFLETVEDHVPGVRVLVILDEFDEIPAELYRRGPLADAFFLTLRTISGKSPFGFVLVGGEKIDLIKSCQGDVFNKFWEVTVDYFRKEEHWTDFQELVRGPTEEWLEVADDALLALYDQTAGNPYFTMCVCRELFRLAVRKRDCFVTRREVLDEAVPRALAHIGTGFYHFWEDGIFESTGVKVEEVSIRRRRILLALAQVLREKDKAGTEEILAQDVVVSTDSYTVENELRRFVQRRVLTEKNGSYDCKVPLFRTWLVTAGMKGILTTFSDRDAILERREKEEQAYVQPEETVDLISQWGLYRGNRITADKVRAWLRQFDDYISQRLMFRVLQGLTFYSTDSIRQKMKEAHGIVQRDLIWHRDSYQRKRGDIVVSYLDSPGKSGGGIYAKLYADENGIYYKNIVERSKLSEVLSEIEGKKALVFIDDFIGSGGSARGYCERLAKECGPTLRDPDLNTYFVAVTGFQESQSEVESTLADLDLPVDVHICDPLDSSARCFGENSRFFPDDDVRLRAMRVAQEHGARIVRLNPLGYGDCQTAIVFPNSCPNNNLPILWAESEEPLWRPLFKRPMPT